MEDTKNRDVYNVFFFVNVSILLRVDDLVQLAQLLALFSVAQPLFALF